jgi:hypothetical protein
MTKFIVTLNSSSGRKEEITYRIVIGTEADAAKVELELRKQDEGSESWSETIPYDEFFSTSNHVEDLYYYAMEESPDYVYFEDENGDDIDADKWIEKYVPSDIKQKYIKKSLEYFE